MRLKQDPSRAEPQKIGSYNEQGWAAYAVERSLFVKHFPRAPAAYPDMGSNFEVFTNEEMLELESLGPLVRLDTDQTVEHVEDWSLFPDVDLPVSDDEAVAMLAPLVARERAASP